METVHEDKNWKIQVQGDTVYITWKRKNVPHTTTLFHPSDKAVSFPGMYLIGDTIKVLEASEHV